MQLYQQPTVRCVWRGAAGEGGGGGEKAFTNAENCVVPWDKFWRDSKNKISKARS